MRAGVAIASLVGALQPLDRPRDALLALGPETRRIRDPVDLGSGRSRPSA